MQNLISCLKTQLHLLQVVTLRLSPLDIKIGPYNILKFGRTIGPFSTYHLFTHLDFGQDSSENVKK